MSEPPRDRYWALYDDLVPLIVPPTGTKGPYYGNRSLRAQWQRVARALEQATHITIIGYSFPTSDLVSRHFLASAYNGCPVTVVDYREGAAGEVARLLRASEVAGYTGVTAVSSYVSATCGNYIRWGTKYSEQGWVPELWVNDARVSLTPGSDEVDPEVAQRDGRSLDAWLDREIDMRWPGLRANESATQVIAVAGDSGVWRGAYTGRPA